MARIAGVDLPKKKRIEYGLTYIYGIGLHTSRQILNKTGISYDKRVAELARKKQQLSAKKSKSIIWSRGICVSKWLWTSKP